jgi:putative transcriptional regulator
LIAKRAEMANLKLKKGNLLIAEPFIGDPNFERSVVFLCDHNDDGSFGFVLNQPLDLKLEDVIDGIYGSFPLFVGGPVEKDTLHFIHRIPHKIEGSVEVGDGIFFSGNFDEVKKGINFGMIEPNDLRFFVGYSGWGAAQLDNEMKQNTWISTKINGDFIFDTPVKDLWRAVLKQMGGDYKILANYPTDPRLN